MQESFGWLYLDEYLCPEADNQLQGFSFIMSEKKFLNETVSRQAKEILLQQRGIVIWITGLSGSGKSTLAHHLEIKLHKAGFLTTLLDGDTLRSGLNATLGFSNEDRTENIRRAA